MALTLSTTALIKQARWWLSDRQLVVTDDSLLEAARSGDRKVLERLLVLEEPRLYAFGLRMCGDPDDARDVMQDTMLAVARHIGSFRKDASLSTWMFQLARSACTKHRRRPVGAPGVHEVFPHEESGAVDQGQDPEQVAVANELAERLDAALQSLSEANREVIVLRDVEGLSAPEVAEILGISVDAVKSRLHRARAGLAEALAKQERAGWVMPVRPATADTRCPDILARWSEREEGELDLAVCAEIEAHVQGCPRCSEVCHGLDRILSACRQWPVVPETVATEVRAAVQSAANTPD